MTYIDLINRMWELREQGILTVHEADLYGYLLHTSNKLRWKNPFNQSTEITCAVLGISRNSLIARRNRLKQVGLLNFKEGISKRRPPEYTLCIQKDTVPDTVLNTVPDTVPDTVVDTLSKDKTREEKTKEVCANRKRFTPPTKEELESYNAKRGNKVDVVKFRDFYESKGWMVGCNRMKDWKACMRTWERSARKGQGYKHPAAGYIQSEESDERFGK